MISTHSRLVDSFVALQSSIKDSEFIRDVLQYCSFDSCVLFDYDNTIGEPTHDSAADEMFDSLLDYALSEMEREEALQLVLMISLVFHYHTQMHPVEGNKTLKIIKILNDLKIPTLLVTARGPELIDVTEQQLDKMNLHFSDFWPKGRFQLNVGNPDKPVIYSDGKIFCNGPNKDDCIKAFFDYIKYRPKSAVMADDKGRHLDRAKKMFNEYFGCEFHGVHYRHLDNKVNHFKNNFNLDSVITTMVKEIPKIKVDKNEISSSAMQAIDQYSVIVLKKESLFKYKQSVEINENLDLSYSTSNKL